MKYNIIYNQEQLNSVIEELLNSQLPINFYYEVLEKPKSKEQLGFFWGGIIQDLLHYFTEQGQTIEDNNKIRKWNSDDVKLWLYHNVIGLEYKILPNGEVVPFMKTISLMSKKELSKFINDCLIFIDNETECVLRPWIRTCWLNHIPDEWYNFLDTTKFTQNDDDFLRYQLKQSCLYCGSRNNIVYHHIKTSKYDGVAQKSPDWFTIPLCHSHHNELHGGGQSNILIGLPLNGFDTELYCKLTYMKWIYKL